MNNIRIGIAQINTTVGDFKGNKDKITSFIKKTRSDRVNLVIFPELAITGYPPQDLIFHQNFVRRNLDVLDEIAAEVLDEIVIIGFVDEVDNKLYNSAAIIRSGKIIAKRYKTLLPNYDVFDELRYFTPAENNLPIKVDINNKKFSLGVEICEDLWDTGREKKVTDELVSKGSDMVINISSSPFTDKKRTIRENLILNKIAKLHKPFIYVNMVGGQGELVFDGNSLGYDKDGKVIAWGGEFSESLTIFDINIKTGTGKLVNLPLQIREESMYNALVLGTRDYLRKSGFSKVVIGLSGGIDSTLVSCIAHDAVGQENVLCVSMPSRFSSEQSIEDAKKLSKSLGIELIIFPIEDIVKVYEKRLHKIFGKLPRDITEENIQARIRGNILMAISNKYNYLVLSTGNKTELALGYCTLYGDMTGGLAVISDVSKSDVYALGNYVNKKANREIIPESITKRTPSAELTKDQVDPFDYNVVSPLVDYIINNQKTKRELMEMGFDEKLIDDISRRMWNAEYKRRQAPPGIKITERAFGIGWRFPIINHFEE